MNQQQHLIEILKGKSENRTIYDNENTEDNPRAFDFLQ
jgi:hypothetical protein